MKDAVWLIATFYRDADMLNLILCIYITRAQHIDHYKNILNLQTWFSKKLYP